MFLPETSGMKPATIKLRSIPLLVDTSNNLAEISGGKIMPRYSLPSINLNHLKKMTSDVGIIRFSQIDQPDLSSGYTLDDNARALVALCMHYELTADNNDLPYIQTYLNFIQRCLLTTGYFEYYINENLNFTKQNRETNPDDATGRAIWALGFLISKEPLLPAHLIIQANFIMQKALPQLEEIHSARAMAFIIKGLFHYQGVFGTNETIRMIEKLANRMVHMYKHGSSKNWEWFESCLMYANSLLPEALLNAWLITRNRTYKKIAVASFRFLLSLTFNNKGLHWEGNAEYSGKLPLGVSHTIMALSKFYDAFEIVGYREKMETAFNWFLGQNCLHQMVYNPCTGGCYDCLEKNNVNLNQGAESTVGYLMARLTVEKYTA
jgi:hypothetical protein